MIYVIFLSDSSQLSQGYISDLKISVKEIVVELLRAHALPLCALFGRCRIVSPRFLGASRACGNSVWTPIYAPLYCIS